MVRVYAQHHVCTLYFFNLFTHSVYRFLYSIWRGAGTWLTDIICTRDAYVTLHIQLTAWSTYQKRCEMNHYQLDWKRKRLKRVRCICAKRVSVFKIQQRDIFRCKTPSIIRFSCEMHLIKQLDSKQKPVWQIVFYNGSNATEDAGYLSLSDTTSV